MNLIPPTGNILYSLLKRIEGKFYKFAKIDFDRTLSLVNLKTLLSYFNDSQQGSLLKQIVFFIESNSEKIKFIFSENRIRFHEVTFITQPEILVYWYCLDYLFFEVVDNWVEDYSIDDLEQIANIWGKSIH